MKAIYILGLCAILGGCKSNDAPKEEAPKEETTNEQETTAAAAKDAHFTVQLTDGFIGRGQNDAYTVYVDSAEKHNGHNTFTIKSLKPKEFATILSGMKPEKSIGKRVEYTAWVKSKDIKGWAGLWLRIDPKDPMNSPNLGFDNMGKRPITGTNDWTKYHIVLDVPEGAANMAYGILLDGDGQVWVDSMDIKIVDKNIPRTDVIGQKVL